MRRHVLAFALAALAVAHTHAQWLDHKDARTPRLPDGTKNLSASR